MKKAIALAVAMTAAAGANAAFERDPYGIGGRGGFTNYYFSAWELDAGGNALVQSVNVDLGIPVYDEVTGMPSIPSSFGSVGIDISALDSTNILWTVFAIEEPGTSFFDYEYYTSGTGAAVLPASFTQTIDTALDWVLANNGPDSVVLANEGTARFGGNLTNPTRAPYQANGQIGQELFLIAYDRQVGTGPNLATVQFTGSQLVFGPVSEVPVPAAAWLFGSALVGLAGVARRRNA